MRINLTSVMVDDQHRALDFYTNVLGFVKKKDIPAGEARWLTVVSPEGPADVELLLEPAGFPPARTYQKALFDAGIPLTSFAVGDLEREYERMKALGVVFRTGPHKDGTGLGRHLRRHLRQPDSARASRVAGSTIARATPVRLSPHAVRPRRAMATESMAAGDDIPGGCRIIEVRVAELKQLFNAIDPSPFRERDLDPRAEEFIVGWSKDLPADSQLALVVYLERAAGPADEASILKDAVRQFFRQRADATRRTLRELFRRGRTSLMIGLAFLAFSIGLGDLIASYFEGSGLADILRESLLIGGWVAMWGPLEIFLYDWWPIRADARLFDRLSAMPVRIVHKAAASPDAWRSDWPAVPASDRSASKREATR